MSLTKDEVQQALIDAGFDLASRSKAIKAVEQLEQAKKDDAAANKGAKLKNKFTILIRGDDAQKAILEKQEAFLVKTPEDVDEDTIIERITISAARQNQAVKRKGRIATYFDWIRLIKGKHRKTADTNVQNVGKEPVRIIVLTSEDIKFAP